MVHEAGLFGGEGIEQIRENPTSTVIACVHRAGARHGIASVRGDCGRHSSAVVCRMGLMASARFACACDFVVFLGFPYGLGTSGFDLVSTQNLRCDCELLAKLHIPFASTFADVR